MPKKDIEGEWIYGWPDRKRPRPEVFKDAEGRVVSARSPILELEGLITPTDSTHIVAQLQMPEPMHPDDYQFSIYGEVDKPRDYTLDEIRMLPGRTIRAVNECAGNDADFFAYLREGSNHGKPSLEVSEAERTHWKHSAGTRREEKPDADALFNAIPSTGHASGGEWTGVPLAEVLKRAGLNDGIVAIRFEGWDEGRPDPTTVYRSAQRTDFEVYDPGIINYDKGLPLEKALHPDTILAWAHNGENLRHVHGAPLRLVVPGWAGNWWVKWLHKIEVMDYMPDCYHQTHYFVSGLSPDDPNKEMMTALGVKSVITEPRDETTPLKRGTNVIRGLAWSGEGAISRVEVSTDGGDTWNDAHIEESPDKWLWKRWSYLWEIDTGGKYRIMARATDETGRTQPHTEWNFMYKHFDGIVPEDVAVE